MCGGVRFEITAAPESAGYCHCTRCQRRTGTAASAQARIAPGSFHLLAGEELIREYAPGDGWPKCFCSNCGSALWSKYPETGEVGSVTYVASTPVSFPAIKYHQPSGPR